MRGDVFGVKLDAMLVEPARGDAELDRTDAPRHRVAAIDGHQAHVAVQQPHDLAALQVDRGNNGELFEQAV